MNNPTVILNGDQVYCDELIRENARLTIQHEVDRQKMEALERQIEDQAANIASLRPIPTHGRTWRSWQTCGAWWTRPSRTCTLSWPVVTRARCAPRCA